MSGVAKNKKRAPTMREAYTTQLFKRSKWRKQKTIKVKGSPSLKVRGMNAKKKGIV